MRSLFKSLQELVFPAVCLICGAALVDMPRRHLCGTCQADFEFIMPPFCLGCGRRFPDAAGGNHYCVECLNKVYDFGRARAVLAYNDSIAALIHSFKYGGRTAVLTTFNEFWRESGLHREFSEMDLIIPVPLHLERLRQRGFNQALLLAETFFPDDRSKIKPHLLTRPLKTVPQTGLSGKARRLNLKNALLVPQPDKIKTKNILIVDDVFTTGTTLNECARVLKAAGAAEVNALTLARVEN